METLTDIAATVVTAGWVAVRACGFLLRLAGIQPFPIAGLGILGKAWSLRRYIAAASWILAAIL